MSYFAFVISVLIGVGSLAYVYAGVGLKPFVQGLVILGVLWLFAGRKRWTWFSTIALLLLVTLAGIGLWFGLSPGWMISGALGGLMAWDLTDFMRRLRFAPLMDDVRGLERRHLTRLTIVAFVGVSLASIAMFVRLEFTFAWGVVLTLVAVLGVTQLVAWLRRS
jgi:hypothetical protein